MRDTGGIKCYYRPLLSSFYRPPAYSYYCTQKLLLHGSLCKRSSLIPNQLWNACTASNLLGRSFAGLPAQTPSDSPPQTTKRIQQVVYRFALSDVFRIYGVPDKRQAHLVRCLLSPPNLFWRPVRIGRVTGRVIVAGR